MGTDKRSRPPGPSFFQAVLDAHSFAPKVTELQLFLKGPGTPNPGMVKPAIARGVFVSWAFVGANEPGDWTLRLRTNEGIIDAATMNQLGSMRMVTPRTVKRSKRLPNMEWQDYVSPPPA